ncbi:hypothetical protein BZL29_8544 [Mycobacterium kansasii]|uniref:Uncharacterized protein n=1 Tax=Mycobacterium kansasii TaxID=1768 RepID=A0A1V3W923_MYCKA|nr:hypothetical protein BZL29_8544 [Mycobacterium kansasii]
MARPGRGPQRRGSVERLRALSGLDVGNVVVRDFVDWLRARTSQRWPLLAPSPPQCRAT